MDITIKPSDINLKSRLCGSGFNKSEYEIIAVNIILIAIRKKNDNWFVFTIDEYKSLCDHDVNWLEVELILEMANQEFFECDENGNFAITQKFIAACLLA